MMSTKHVKASNSIAPIKFDEGTSILSRVYGGRISAQSDDVLFCVVFVKNVMSLNILKVEIKAQLISRTKWQRLGEGEGNRDKSKLMEKRQV